MRAEQNLKFHVDKRIHPLHIVWTAMKSRCECKTNKNFKYYGEKGISLCPQWKKPEYFIKWGLRNGWRIGLSIDRIDPEKGYSPRNCQFLTLSENTSKMHRQKKIKFLRKRYYKLTVDVLDYDIIQSR